MSRNVNWQLRMKMVSDRLPRNVSNYQ